MVVGAQKAATTWLFECLNAHPEICVPDLKEVHFFCRPEDCRFSRRKNDTAWYESLYPARGYRAWGELTTDYMFFPYVAADLHAYNPRLKIIFMLRDPVDRAYSAYWMWRRHRSDLPRFREMLEREPAYIGRGLYYRQIRPYIDLFGADCVRIYIYEEAMRATSRFLTDVYAFIGVDPTIRPAVAAKSIGGTRAYPRGVGFFVYKILSPIINTPAILPVWRAFRRASFSDAVLDRLVGAAPSREQGYPQIDEADRAYLARAFQEENERLFGLLGRRIEDWAAVR